MDYIRSERENAFYWLSFYTPYLTRQQRNTILGQIRTCDYNGALKGMAKAADARRHGYANH